MSFADDKTKYERPLTLHEINPEKTRIRCPGCSESYGLHMVGAISTNKRACEIGFACENCSDHLAVPTFILTLDNHKGSVHAYFHRVELKEIEIQRGDLKKRNF